METYKIVRFYASGRKSVIKSGQTLAEAQRHCQDPSTSKPGKWFDGYTREQ